MNDVTTTRRTAGSGEDLHREVWGEGEPVLLVHGSLAIGAEEWEAQRPLGEAGYRLTVLDRRGYGASPAATGEDYLVDADDLLDLMGDGAHLVGHSYGGLGVMFAAARRPEATRSIAVLEPPAGQVTADPTWRSFIADMRALWRVDLDDEAWVVRFLTAVGSDPAQFPPEFMAAALPLVPVFRHGRSAFEVELPLAELAAARFPKLVVSGGHNPGFEAMCIDLARHIGAAHTVIAGAGHEIQFTGPPINDALVALWRSAAAR